MIKFLKDLFKKPPVLAPPELKSMSSIQLLAQQIIDSNKNTLKMSLPNKRENTDFWKLDRK